MGKPHQPPQLQTVLNGGFGIACGGSHDVIGSAEDPLVAVLHAVDLPPGHGVGGDEFDIRTEHGLDPLHNGPFHAGCIGKKRAGAEVLLVAGNPFDKHVGIKGKNDKLRLPYDLRERFGIAKINDPVLQGIVDILLL